MRRIDTIEREIAPLREQLKSHDLYYHLSGVEDIKVFMEKHVFAVWDFMSLLKALQRNLTCIDMPWKPSQNAKTARFINEIVLEEESDLNENGVPKSHFEMYLDAMKEVGANPDRILGFIRNIDSMQSLVDQLPYANLKKAEREFLEFTFKIIQTGQSHKIAAAFTFGREDVIPDMFIEIINKSNTSNHNQFPKLSYYLNRHIELDGDEHGPLALEMIAELCGEDEEKWQDVQSVSMQALEKRIQLWDEITAEINQNKAALVL
jgi:hypothetical protein